MNERVLEQRLEGWYADQLSGMTAPASLRASVANIPHATQRPFAFRISPAWAMILLLGLLLALTAGAIATGAIRLPGDALSTDEMLITVDNRILAVDVRTGASRDVAHGTLIALSPDRSRFIRAVSVFAFECYVTKVDGTDERKLDACGSNASWSPDGAKVLFYDGGFFIADVATGQVKHLPWKESFKDTGTGSWSPDGRKVVIPALGQLVIADADGHPLGSIPAAAFGPRWSPDGRNVVWWELNGNWIVSNAEVGGAQFGKDVISGAGMFPAWSPDGAQIAYITGHSLRVVDSDGRNDRLLDDHAYPYAPGPQWSADGSQILYGGNEAESGISGGPMMAIDVATGASHVVFPTVSFNYAW
jgi:hypothetical protein